MSLAMWGEKAIDSRYLVYEDIRNKSMTELGIFCHLITAIGVLLLYAFLNVQTFLFLFYMQKIQRRN